MPLLIPPLLIIIAGIIFYASIVIIPAVIATHYFHIVDYGCLREQIQEQKPTQCDPVYPNREHQESEIAATEQGKPGDRPRPEVTEKRDNTQDPKALRNSLLTGAQLIRTYRDDEREMKRLTEALEFTHDEGDEVNFNKFQKALRDAAERKRLTFRMYLQSLGELQSKFSQHELQSALSLLGGELAVDGKPSSLAQFAGLFVFQAENFRQQSGIDEETIGQKLNEFEVKQ
jgi:hypothetical protein